MLRPEPSAAERGNVLHDIMDRFLRGLPDLPETPEVMTARLLSITDAVLERDVPWPSARPPKSIREQIERNRWPR